MFGQEDKKLVAGFSRNDEPLLRSEMVPENFLIIGPTKMGKGDPRYKQFKKAQIAAMQSPLTLATSNSFKV